MSSKQSYHQHKREEHRQLREKRRREMISAGIDTAHEEFDDGDHKALVESVAMLINLLDADEAMLQTHDLRLSQADIEWHYGPIRSAVNDPTAIFGMSDAGVEAVLKSIGALAAAEGYLPELLQTSQPVIEYETQIGERYLRSGSRASGDVKTIDAEEDDLKATLFTGGQGSGKSTALETVAEDRIARGHKIIDLVDFYKSENAIYDIPDQSDLKDHREEMGLSTGFGDEYDAPDVEVLAPLSPDLSQTRVPVRDRDDGDEVESVVKPFTIPASDLTYKQLVMLLPHTTKTHENYLRSAHQKLDNSGKDWTLADVARVVRAETNASEKVADRIARALQTAQQKSFIRDKECEHSLDWDEVMADSDIVTAFTAHMIREPTDQLLVVSYLLDCVYDERKRLLRERKLTEYPTLSVLMRELHNIAPRQKAEQDSEKTIEGYMIDTMSELISLMRHVEMEIIADTQKFQQQLSPQVSGLFHRVFCFRGQKPDIRKVFRTRVDPDNSPEEKITQYGDGQCALVSDDGYTMPIQFAPPRCHHLDASKDGDAFSFRASVLDDERLVDAPWDTSIPERLSFRDSSKDPIETWIDEFLTKTTDPDDFVIKQDITDAYNEWARLNDYDEASHQYVLSRVRDRFNLGDQHEYYPQIDGKQRTAYRMLQLDESLC